jgi:hypothetical protein
MGAVILLIIMIAIYFLPAIIAFNRNHHNALAIVVLDVFLGWTLVGWVIALVWACTLVRAHTDYRTVESTPTAIRAPVKMDQSWRYREGPTSKDF